MIALMCVIAGSVMFGIALGILLEMRADRRRVAEDAEEWLRAQGRF